MLRSPWAFMVTGAGIVACGSRTDLGPAPGHDPGRTSDASPTFDAAHTVDAARPFDASLPPDARVTLDVVKPPDASRLPRCGDGGAPEAAYVFDGAGVLYHYDPTRAVYAPIGSPGCEQTVPWTMTVSRSHAYVLYTDWNLYAVDLQTLACSPTAFRSGQLGLDFEYGIAVADIGGVERFFVYGEPGGGGQPMLAESDLSSFVLTKVGDIQPLPPSMSFPINLTADSYGHLYAYSPVGELLQIDAATGAVLLDLQTGFTTSGTWATLTFGRRLFLFADDRVAGYDVSTQTETSVNHVDIAPIGAGSFLLCP